MGKKQATKKGTTAATTRPSSSKSSGGRKASTSSSSSWKKGIFTSAAVIIVLVAALSYNFFKNAIIDLGLLLGKVQPFNTAGCEVVKGLEACEDVHIHHASGLAFTTCGHAESRKNWYPPMGNNNASAENAFQDKFVIYNIKSGTYEVAELAGLPAETDRVFHGLDIYERSATELTIFAVNHRRTGSVIEVLEYTVGDKAVQYKETIKHELIRTPNDIVALGPRSFYVSNDHRHLTGIMRYVEEILRMAWTNVIYYSPENTFIAYEPVTTANGMAANADRSVIYLSACFGGAIHVLKPRDNYTLVEEDYVKLDFITDNPSYDAETDSVFITGHVQPMKMVQDLRVPGKSVAGASKIVKISKNPQAKISSDAPKYLIEPVLVDDGNLISSGTTAALDRKYGMMLVGTAFSDKGLVRCPIPEGF
ncbi:Serum paraoxonase/arylesterase 2 [Modicella reniformis]|uniref:Serum paraoxonase/arylesterase 2 n=1 Tax=Modicella reniformis TaxID=1440133 RepID=A0A9P6MKK7_9FUNG|nr:Serum paraoxonase/arylesterase 2 [Modicella reniformis]